MVDLGLALFLAIVATGIGKRLLECFDQLPAHPLDALALSAPLGLGLLSLSCLGLGQAGWLNLAGLLVVLGLATELGLFTGLRLLRSLFSSWRCRSEGNARLALDRILLLFLVLSLGASAMGAMAPVTDGDALCYHLQVPKVFLIRQSTYFDPDLHETVYPLVTELLYAIALEFRGPVACRALQWVLGLVLVAGVTALARPSLGPRAWWAGCLVALVPAISIGMAAPLNDVALAAFGVAALFAWTRFQDAPSVPRAAVAGVFMGLAMGVKYPALVLAGLLTVATFLRPLLVPVWRTRCKLPSLLLMAGTFVGAAMLVGGPWYLRAFVHTGNPVFPFFKSLFAGAGLEEVLAPTKRPLAVTPWNLAGALAPMTLQPDRFDSFAHQFGPIFLFFLPALLLERTPRRILYLMVIAYVFVMLCMTQRQSMRFVLFAVGPMSVGVAFLATRWLVRTTLAARALLVLLMLLLGLETGLSLARGARAAGVVLGSESFPAFLVRQEPSFRVGRWISLHLPATARLIGQDHRGFYIPRAYTMELAHRRRTGLGKKGESSRQIVETLRHEGYTHLMMCPPLRDGAVEFDPTLGRLLESWLAGRAPVFHEEMADSDGVVRSYSIYELSSQPEQTARHAQSIAR